MAITFNKPFEQQTERVFGTGTLTIEVPFMPDYFDARFIDTGVDNDPATVAVTVTRNSPTSYTVEADYDSPRRRRLLQLTVADLYIDPEQTINN